jgi:hypothetical protein
MNKNIWAELDKEIDLDGLKEDVKASSDGGGGDFKEVEHGTYEVSVEKLYLGKSKKGDPMMTVWFNILAGPFKGSKIFYNQVLTGGFQIHLASTLLRGFETAVEVSFEGYAHFAEVIEKVKAAIESDGLEFSLEYGEDKGWNTFKITEVFES